MKKMNFIVLIIVLCFSLISGVFVQKGFAAEGEFDCSKHQDKIWVGEISNPTKLNLHVQIFNNERVNGTDLIGIDKPYFDTILAPDEKAKIEYQCGENSAIFSDKETNTFRSLDFHVPKTFREGKDKNFEFELQSKKFNI